MTPCCEWMGASSFIPQLTPSGEVLPRRPAITEPDPPPPNMLNTTDSVNDLPFNHASTGSGSNSPELKVRQPTPDIFFNSQTKSHTPEALEVAKSQDARSHRDETSGGCVSMGMHSSTSSVPAEEMKSSPMAMSPNIPSAKMREILEMPFHAPSPPQSPRQVPQGDRGGSRQRNRMLPGLPKQEPADDPLHVTGTGSDDTMTVVMVRRVSTADALNLDRMRSESSAVSPWNKSQGGRRSLGLERIATGSSGPDMPTLREMDSYGSFGELLQDQSGSQPDHPQFTSSLKGSPSSGQSARKFPSMLGSANLRSVDSVKLAENNVTEDFTLIEEIGRGSFGFVQKAVRKCDQQEVAIKSITYQTLLRHNDGTEPVEFDIAKRLRHPNIAALYSIYTDDQYVHLVMELCNGGDLFQKVTAGRYLSADEVGQYLWQMISGIAYFHHNNFCHRDLKPENYMLDCEGPSGVLKLIDFGLARCFTRGTPMKSKVGSTLYVAPEVFQGSYDEGRDIWSIGVITFLLCTRRAPFDAVDDDAIRHAITDGKIMWAWLDIQLRGEDHPLKLLIHRMLTEEPKLRPQATAISQDPWLRDHGNHGMGKAIPHVEVANRPGCRCGPAFCVVQ